MWAHATVTKELLSYSLPMMTPEMTCLWASAPLARQIAVAGGSKEYPMSSLTYLHYTSSFAQLQVTDNDHKSRSPREVGGDIGWIKKNSGDHMMNLFASRRPINIKCK